VYKKNAFELTKLENIQGQRP